MVYNIKRYGSFGVFLLFFSLGISFVLRCESVTFYSGGNEIESLVVSNSLVGEDGEGELHHVPIFIQFIENTIEI